MKPESDEDIPEFEAIYRDDSDEEESHSNSDDDENDDYGNKKKKRFDESAILKRRDRRLWEEQRRKILFDYEQFSYIGKLKINSIIWILSCDFKLSTLRNSYFQDLQ